MSDWLLAIKIILRNTIDLEQTQFFLWRSEETLISKFHKLLICRKKRKEEERKKNNINMSLIKPCDSAFVVSTPVFLVNFRSQ